MNELCRFRIETDSIYGLCTVGESELGTHQFSTCHRKLCTACTKQGEKTKNTAEPNRFLASVLVGAATTAMAQPSPVKPLGSLKGRLNDWKNFLRSVDTDGKTIETKKLDYNRPNRCEHLGAVPISRISCNCPKKHTYECGRFKSDDGLKLHVIPAKQCETCNGYEDSEEG